MIHSEEETLKENHLKQHLKKSIMLPCGAVLKNRLAKSAMSDSLGNGEGNPTQAQIRLYERWAQGGVALSIIGEVQIDFRYPEKPGNLVFGLNSDLEALRELTKRASIEGTHIWPQLGNAGALSHQPISIPTGPSALHIDHFKCEGMSLADIKSLPKSYAKAALLAKESGFTGVQIHAGHGFLLSQFLSPLFNRRKDQYGDSIENRCRLLIDIIDQVRMAVGPAFPIGIKINASDLIEGGVTQEDALENIRLLDKTSLDLIEISGGTYFPGAKSSSDSARKGVYFAEFAKQAKKLTKIVIMVTGGIKSKADAQNLLAHESSDLIGLARALILDPNLAKHWLDDLDKDPGFPSFDAPPPEGITSWYTMRINAIALDQEKDFSLPLDIAIEQYQKRDELRCIQWQKVFA